MLRVRVLRECSFSSISSVYISLELCQANRGPKEEKGKRARHECEQRREEQTRLSLLFEWTLPRLSLLQLPRQSLQVERTLPRLSLLRLPRQSLQVERTLPRLSLLRLPRQSLQVERTLPRLSLLRLPRQSLQVERTLPKLSSPTATPVTPLASLSSTAALVPAAPESLSSPSAAQLTSPGASGPPSISPQSLAWRRKTSAKEIAGKCGKAEFPRD